MNIVGKTLTEAVDTDSRSDVIARPDGKGPKDIGWQDLSPKGASAIRPRENLHVVVTKGGEGWSFTIQKTHLSSREEAKALANAALAALKPLLK